MSLYRLYIESNLFSGKVEECLKICLLGCHLWGRAESDTTEATQQQQQHTSREHHTLSARPNSEDGMFGVFFPFVSPSPTPHYTLKELRLLTQDWEALPIIQSTKSLIFHSRITFNFLRKEEKYYKPQRNNIKSQLKKKAVFFPHRGY